MLFVRTHFRFQDTQAESEEVVAKREQGLLLI